MITLRGGTSSTLSEKKNTIGTFFYKFLKVKKIHLFDFFNKVYLTSILLYFKHSGKFSTDSYFVDVVVKHYSPPDLQWLFGLSCMD